MGTNDGENIRKTGAPEWATQPFQDFLDFIKRLLEVVELSTTGISILRGMPRLVEVLASVKEVHDTPVAKGKLDRARRQAELAEREASTGFPLIHAQATVSLWGALEDLLRTFVASWLQHVPAALLNPPLSTCKVAIGDYERLSPEEKGLFMADLLDRAINGSLKLGVTRFETLLEPLGLSGAIADDIRRDIFELSQVRHVIAHRRGIADRRLAEACPWLPLAVGKPVIVTHNDIHRYHTAVGLYVTELIYRVGEHFGVSDIRNEAKRDELGDGSASEGKHVQ